jgi:hypothetical protein
MAQMTEHPSNDSGSGANRGNELTNEKARKPPCMGDHFLSPFEPHGSALLDYFTDQRLS